MRVKEVEFGFTKNMGNYQSQKASVVVEVGENDTEEAAFNKARMTVMKALGMTKEYEKAKKVVDEWEGR